jgi:hypothetical protein
VKRWWFETSLDDFLANEAAGGLVLMAVAALALVVANSPLAPAYFGALNAYIFGLSVIHWINDALMAGFFLLVGLEIKREVTQGQLRQWSQRVLPGAAALGGLVVPALIYAGLNARTPETLGGWAIPSATDIAFALGVLSLLGPRVPVSLKVFLTALAIIDDLAAVVIIAVFHTAAFSLPMFAASLTTLLVLVGLNWRGVRHLAPYLILGVVLWIVVFRCDAGRRRAGIHCADRTRASRAGGDRAALDTPGARSASLGGIPDCADLRLCQRRRVIRRHQGCHFGCTGNDWCRIWPFLGQAAWCVRFRLGGDPDEVGRDAVARELDAALWRGAALRHRLHHESVYRPARLSGVGTGSGPGQDWCAWRLALFGAGWRAAVAHGAPRRACGGDGASARLRHTNPMRSTGQNLYQPPEGLTLRRMVGRPTRPPGVAHGK